MQTAVESPVACALVAQFDLHTKLFNNVLEGLSDLETNSRPTRETNNIKWLAGHRPDHHRAVTRHRPRASFVLQSSE